LNDGLTSAVARRKEHDVYQKALNRLLRDLRIENG
jgi:hypothetical protein